jgi:hypothetical protein
MSNSNSIQPRPALNCALFPARLQVSYEQQVFSAVLRFWEAWEVCHSKPWQWATPAPAATAGTAGTAAGRPPPPPAAAAAGAAGAAGSSAGPPPLPLWPTSVADMVLHTLAVHNTPIAGTLAIPATNISLQCPGVALELPYQHDVYLEHLRTGARVVGDGGSNPASPAVGQAGAGAGSGGGGAEQGRHGAPPPQLYMFVSALQNIKLRVTGENASKCLQVRCRRC